MVCKAQENPFPRIGSNAYYFQHTNNKITIKTYKEKTKTNI